MNASRTQIIATIGPASRDREVLKKMIEHEMDLARLNFSHGTLEEHAEYIKTIREVADEAGRKVPIIQDLPGPRIQKEDGHTYDKDASVITEEDQEFIKFGVEQKVDYIAVSYVKDEGDIEEARGLAGDIPLIAKIEREEAVHNIDGIIEASDAVMIARGDLGDNIPLEKVPFVQIEIIEKVKAHKKPSIVATEMLLSMTHNERPTRAEVTDVAYAIIHKADAVMLSEETAQGEHPVESVTMMERIVLEAERVSGGLHTIHTL